MNELSKERLEELANAEYCKANPGKWLLGLAEINAMARELLALRERAKPVAWMKRSIREAENWDSVDPEFVKSPEGWMSDYLPLYTAPPAPVVPDERYQQLSELYHALEKRLFKMAQRIKGPAFDKYAYSPSQAIDVLEVAIFGENDDTCRASMLKAGPEQEV